MKIYEIGDLIKTKTSRGELFYGVIAKIDNDAMEGLNYTILWVSGPPSYFKKLRAKLMCGYKVHDVQKTIELAI